jgi:uncharacterized protein (UPF0147 family)
VSEKTINILKDKSNDETVDKNINKVDEKISHNLIKD